MNKERVKQKILDTVHNTLFSVVKKSLDQDNAKKRVMKVREKYKGLPNDVVSGILIKYAVRKTTIEGGSNSVAISGCEGLIAAPVPDAAHKIAAGTGVITFITTDVAYTTKVQMQLLLEIAELYDCPYDNNDEDDVWLIFKAALGLKGVERTTVYGRFIFNEAAKKQFRRLLRTGIRKSLQDRVGKIAGRQVARYLGEKYILRLIPILNIAIGAEINHKITKQVGKYAKVKAKIRSSLFNSLKKIEFEDATFLKWTLPIIFYIGTIDDKLTDNHLMVYSQVNNRINLNKNEEKFILNIINDEKIEELLFDNLSNIKNENIKKSLFDISLSCAAVNLKFSNNINIILQEISKVLGNKYSKKDLKNKIKYFSS